MLADINNLIKNFLFLSLRSAIPNPQSQIPLFVPIFVPRNECHPSPILNLQSTILNSLIRSYSFFSNNETLILTLSPDYPIPYYLFSSSKMNPPLEPHRKPRQE